MSLTSYRAAPPRVIRCQRSSAVRRFVLRVFAAGCRVWAFWGRGAFDLQRRDLRAGTRERCLSGPAAWLSCDWRICGSGGQGSIISNQKECVEPLPASILAEAAGRPCTCLLTSDFRHLTSVFGMPGGDLLSHGLSRSTIGAGAFHGRVRDGIGCLSRRKNHQADRRQKTEDRGQKVRMRDFATNSGCGACRKARQPVPSDL
jgi:hypothetical protein